MTSVLSCSQGICADPKNILPGSVIVEASSDSLFFNPPGGSLLRTFLLVFCNDFLEFFQTNFSSFNICENVHRYLISYETEKSFEILIISPLWSFRKETKKIRLNKVSSKFNFIARQNIP